MKNHESHQTGSKSFLKNEYEYYTTNGRGQRGKRGCEWRGYLPCGGYKNSRQKKKRWTQLELECL